MRTDVAEVKRLSHVERLKMHVFAFAVFFVYQGYVERHGAQNNERLPCLVCFGVTDITELNLYPRRRTCTCFVTRTHTCVQLNVKCDWFCLVQLCDSLPTRMLLVECA